MKFDEDLHNAAMIGENPETAFIAEGNRLHAVEQHIADLKKDKCKPEIILPLMRQASDALHKFADGKVPPSFIEAISMKPTEKEQLIEKIASIYSHLPKHDRHELSSLIHHKQMT